MGYRQRRLRSGSSQRNETIALEGVANGGGFDYRALTRLNPELVVVNYRVP